MLCLKALIELIVFHLVLFNGVVRPLFALIKIVMTDLSRLNVKTINIYENTRSSLWIFIDLIVLLNAIFNLNVFHPLLIY